MLLLFLTLFLFLNSHTFSEGKKTNIDELRKNAPKVFLDCTRCDYDFIKTEITFVNFVRDRKEADIHVLVTTERTGSGGWEYTMAFIGQRNYADIQATLKYVSKQMDTRDDTRRGIVKVLKIGLAPYMTKTALGDCVSVSFDEYLSPTSVEDKWNFWVFSLSLNGSLRGEKLRNSFSVRGNFSANRVTPEFKIRMGVSANFDQSNFTIDGETIHSYSDRKSFSGLLTKSISEHWSAGAWLSLYSSTYSNIEFSVNPAPAVEYNFFPYSQATRRELRFLYRIGFNFVNYNEVTIYDKTSEKLLSQALSVIFEVKEPWGNASTSLTGSHYFHDFSKNRLEIDADLNLRLFKGLSLGVHGGFSAIHDQLSLRKGESSTEDILLRRTELATNYSYYGSIGFSYTFGSLYSNVVNPRFGR